VRDNPEYEKMFDDIVNLGESGSTTLGRFDADEHRTILQTMSKSRPKTALKPLTKKAMSTPNYTPALTAKCVRYKTLSVSSDGSEFGTAWLHLAARE
jgi:hypothetical protein